MFLRFLIFSWLSILSLNAMAQDYFNRIIPFADGNPTVNGVYKMESTLLIPVIYPGEISSIVIVTENEVEYSYFSDFDFSRTPLTTLNGEIYSFAKDRSFQSGLRFGKISNDYELEWRVNIDTEFDFDFPTASISDETGIYSSYLLEADDPYHREVGIVKHDSLGNEIWKNNYSQENRLTYPWSIINTYDKNILLSAGVNYNIGKYSQLTKIDANGEILWQYAGDEDFDHGAVPTWVAELSDSSILLTYVVDRWGDEEFIINGWNTKPVRLKWFDRFGEPTKEVYWNVPKTERMTLNGLQKGNGDYFFAFGRYETFEDQKYYGIINKMTNAGDTIWAARYKHPDFSGANIPMIVNHIIEKDNGDIIGVGTISPVGEGPKIWLFQVNEFGCFDNSSYCQELVTGINSLENKNIEVNIFPNPVSKKLFVDGDVDIERIKIMDINGLVVRESKETEIDLSNLVAGIYIVDILFENGNLARRKFIKI